MEIIKFEITSKIFLEKFHNCDSKHWRQFLMMISEEIISIDLYEIQMK